MVNFVVSTGCGTACATMFATDAREAISTGVYHDIGRAAPGCPCGCATVSRTCPPAIVCCTCEGRKPSSICPAAMPCCAREPASPRPTAVSCCPWDCTWLGCWKTVARMFCGTTCQFTCTFGAAGCEGGVGGCVDES